MTNKKTTKQKSHSLLADTKKSLSLKNQMAELKKGSEEKLKERYVEAVGRRKTAVSRARLFPAFLEKEIVVNGKRLIDYFPLAKQQKIVNAPFETVSFWCKTSLKVKGGGLMAQAQASRLALSRALVFLNKEWRSLLKAKGFLTRDSRVVERKKFGRRKARRAQQWRKR